MCVPSLVRNVCFCSFSLTKQNMPPLENKISATAEECSSPLLPDVQSQSLPFSKCLVLFRSPCCYRYERRTGVHGIQYSSFLAWRRIHSGSSCWMIYYPINWKIRCATYGVQNLETSLLNVNVRLFISGCHCCCCRCWCCCCSIAVPKLSKEIWLCRRRIGMAFICGRFCCCWWQQQQ